ncbi:two-component system sensor histidine kinase QseC [Haemophilus paracuniculus]|uniref:histidine kinase n=1 Tax=Haemophilus paracuniculus TaxID=734 RepID=A0A1T0AQU8_9PAST|nr:ATP-binding protein [Haemophilus paracuniculus]OOR98469.1 two-component system sensor histidine kinase QseC [Haemophilus paracuniculus]
MLKFGKNRSLRYRLIVSLSSITLLIGLISSLTGWLMLRKEINDLFDAQQIYFAERLASSNITEGFQTLKTSSNAPTQNVEDDAIAFAIFDQNGTQIFHDGRDGRFIPFAPKNGGFNQQIVQEEDDRDEYRIYWLQDGDLYIAVGQEIEYRQEVIGKAVVSQLGSWAVGFPLVILAILWFIYREFAPLKQLARQVSERKPDETTPIVNPRLPSEIQPLVTSLNHYFERTQTMFNRERRFTSDAAHELRSPLAGLRVQAEIAQMAQDDPETHQRALKNIEGSIDRISQLIEQLLTLSRLENITQLDELESVNWQSIAESNVSQLYALAEQKQSDLYLDIESEPPPQQGKPLLLSLVLRNLIENAIHYTPSGSLIKILLKSDRLIVEDNGNGVSDSDLAKLGQPFYRPVDRPTDNGQDEKGSGLGLSIVKRILALHHFQLKLSRSELGGLKAEILF